MAMKTGMAGSISISPQRASKKAAARRRQEKAWARKCGPIKVYFDPSIIKAKTSEG